tara:strand:+ start:2928 stop:3503 length:576 start_codon:yes stop_codon:yes gene_type:complete
MIYTVDDFISKDLFNSLTSYLNEGDFITEKVGEKKFHIKLSLKSFDDYVLHKLSLLEGRQLENILSFFRVSTDELDNTWRIHSDLNINGQRPDRAIVLYMSPRELEELHGTAFWEHQIYGKELPKDTTDETYDKMIKVDSEDLDKWRLVSVSGYEQNRLISYPASYFHSKYPNKSWPEGRQIYVMFYKFKN